MRTFGIVALITGYWALFACTAIAAVDQDRRQPHGERGVQKRARELPQAFITSKRVVYGYGHPIDLTFSIATPKDGEVLPAFEIEAIDRLSELRAAEQASEVAPRQVDGQHIWEAPGESFDGKKREGALPAGQQYTETIADLREWYELDAAGPGTYRVTFAGEWIDTEGEQHSLSSNSIIVRIARPPSEVEPEGEPTEGHVVPLSEIWAMDMPGTKPMDRGMQSIDPRVYRAPEGRMVDEIVLLHMTSEEILAPAREGFVVRGSGIEALRRAHSVLVDKQEPDTTFAHGETLSLVFFTKSIFVPVHIERVEVLGSLIDLSYRFDWPGGDLPAVQPMNTHHIAIIPLQLNDIGRVHVEIRPISYVEIPDISTYIRNLIAGSFDFTVVR